MIFEQEKSFAKQIILYIKNEEYNLAHSLSREFIEIFPNSLMAHYLFAKSCYRVNDFVSALSEGHKAFNLAESKDDLICIGVFLACVYYELRRYTKGLEVLTALNVLEDERVEKAMFILLLCRNDPTEALMHVDALYSINKEIANDFVDRFLEFAGDIK